MSLQTVKDEEGNRNIDRISDMPDEVLHQILSCLPTTDVSLVPFISKRWRYLPRYLNVMDFNELGLSIDKKLCMLHTLESRVMKPAEHLRMKQWFINFVTHTLRLHHPSIDIKTFRLDLHWSTTFWYETQKDFLKICSQVNEWIEKTLEHNLQELELDMPNVSKNKTFFQSEQDDSKFYILPESVFGSQLITTLKLSWCKIDEQEGVVNLLSLRTLCLKKVKVNDKTLQKVIATSQLLETVCLEKCHELTTLKGKLINLRHLQIKACFSMKKFDMETPNLWSFKFWQNGWNKLELSDFVLDFRRLATLLLIANLPNGFIEFILSKCIRLENFTLGGCPQSDQFSIFSQKLKRVKIVSWDKLKKFEIDAPNLTEFEYIGTEMVEVFRMNTSSNLSARLQFTSFKFPFKSQGTNEPKLKEFLERFDHVKAVTLVCCEAERVLIQADLLYGSLPPLYNLKHLILEAGLTKAQSCKQVLVGLLMLSVHLESLTVNLGEHIMSLKFRPEKVKEEDWYEFPRLNWSDLPLDHLQRRLIEFKLKGTKDANGKELIEFICQESGIEGKSSTYEGISSTYEVSGSIKCGVEF